MSWNHPIHDRISEAIESGELEFPESHRGQPLDLSDYFATPEDLRVGYSILKSSGFAPLQVDLLRQLRRLEESVEREKDPERLSELQLLMAEVNAKLGDQRRCA